MTEKSSFHKACAMAATEEIDGLQSAVLIVAKENGDAALFPYHVGEPSTHARFDAYWMLAAHIDNLYHMDLNENLVDSRSDVVDDALELTDNIEPTVHPGMMEGSR